MSKPGKNAPKSSCCNVGCICRDGFWHCSRCNGRPESLVWPEGDALTFNPDDFDLTRPYWEKRKSRNQDRQLDVLPFLVIRTARSLQLSGR